MKKQFLNFVFLFLFFLFIPSAQSKIVEDFWECSIYGTTAPCKVWLEYGCPQEGYYGAGSLPEENIIYGSNVNQRNVFQTCISLESSCSQGSIEYDDWALDTINNPEGCNYNEYCDKNTDGFFCHLADECNSEIYSGDFPDKPLSPKNNEYGVVTPTSLDWCDVLGFYSYRIKLYTVEEETIQVKVLGEDGKWVWVDEEVLVDVFQEEVITNNSHACLKNLEEDTTYKWTLAYCRGEDGSNCEIYQPKWKFDTGEKQNVSPPTSGLSPAFLSSNSLPLTLKWNEEGEEKSYYVEIYNANGYTNGEKPVWLQSTTDTEIEDVYVKPNSAYEWRVASCANINGTACGDNCCDNEAVSECGDFYPSVVFDYLLLFTTNNEIDYDQTILTNPVYSNDESIPVVNPYNQLRWEDNPGGVAYRCDINVGDESITIFSETNYLDLEPIWEDLKSNSVHSWTITPCSRETSDCQNNAKSEQWKFKTSGGVTSIIYPSNGASNVPSDISFEWSKASDPLSYIYEIERASGGVATGTTPFNRVSFSYPEEAIGQTYFWRVKACDGISGTYCGDDWHTANFTIADFVAPSNPYPVNGDSLFTYENLSWKSVLLAKAYKYNLQYNQRAEEENREICINSEGSMIAENFVFSNRLTGGEKIKCLGEYEWWVTACFNSNCEGETRTSPHWTFTSIKSKGTEGGILPCNRKADNVDTPWDETESCKIKHVPIFFYNLLDFLLWKASLMILIFLIIASGVYSYAAAGLPIKIVSLKDVWVAAGKGYSIAFLAWTIINLVLKLFGITDVWLILPF